MTQEMESRPQPDSSGLIPVILFVWLASAALYGIIWVGAGCYEVLSDVVNGAIKLIFSG